MLDGQGAEMPPVFFVSNPVACGLYKDLPDTL